MADGFLIAVIAIILNGSFAAVFKRFMHEIDTNTYMIYFSVGSSVSWWIAIIFLPYNQPSMNQPEFCTDGLYVGILLSSVFYFIFEAVKLIGLAVSQGIFAGINITSSFLVGLFVFKDKIVKPIFAVFGLLLLCGGVLIVAFSKELLPKADETKHELVEMPSMGKTDNTSNYLLMEDPLPDPKSGYPVSGSESPFKKNQSEAAAFRLGLILLLVGGILGGFVLAPHKYDHDPQCHGFAYLPTVAITFLLTSVAKPLLVRVVGAMFGQESLEAEISLISSFKKYFLFAAAAGAIFGVAFVFFAVSAELLGFAIAGPLFQCAVVVNGLWGIFYFGELRGRAMGGFFFGAAVVICGAALLAQATIK